MRLFRLLKIIFTLYRFGLYEIIQNYYKASFFAKCLKLFLWYIPIKYKNKSLPERTRLAFEELGPVFVKFGQVLSTRQDLIPAPYIFELSKLQSEVLAFDGKIARQIVELSLQQKLEDIFANFSEEAVASASIAQVHKAVLRDSNYEVAIKVLRPNIKNIINKDIKVLELVAWIITKIFQDGKRLKLKQVIAEFNKTINAELDFLQEAANATELRRLHKNDTKIIIPKILYDYCTSEIIVMEWMNGIPISDLVALEKNNIDLKQLSHNGVAIFYNQVFNYGFFHADMHPGNILCDLNGRYVALDFGIVGCLSEYDKRYLAINILAFFNRNYKKVAIAHIESGWAPKNTSIEDLESAIRAVCEPIFNKPLSQISFGQVLIKLFQVSRRFGITVQPQLILLQKTIVNVEGLGRMLNPDLDLWVTAKPILEHWMKRQMGFRGFIHNLKQELPYWSYALPVMPRLFIKTLEEIEEVKEQNKNFTQILKNYRLQNNLLLVIALVLGISLFLKITII